MPQQVIKSSRLPLGVVALLCLVPMAAAALVLGCGGAGHDSRVGQGPWVPEEFVDATKGASLDSILSLRVEDGFAGSVLVGVDGEIVLHKGYGQDGGNPARAIGSQTVFCVASLTKLFTAAAILRLAEQERLTLRDTLPMFFSQVPVEKQPIRIRELLDHGSGLDQNWAADGIQARDRAVEALLARPLIDAPGDAFRYSNDGYNLLAAVIEVAAGTSYEEFLAREIFEPAAMRSYLFWGMTDRKEHEHIAAFNGEVSATNRKPNWGYRGATGLYLTTGDLYRWYWAWRQNTVVTEESEQQMLAPRWDFGALAVTYGWFLSPTEAAGQAVWMRGSESFGHNAILYMLPEKNSVLIAASNAGRWGNEPYTRRIVRELEAFLYPAGPTPAE